MGYTERVVLFSHPDPGYRQLAEASLDELRHAKHLGKAVHPNVLTTRASSEGNVALVREHVFEGDTIALIGGDGTWRLFHKGLIEMAQNGSTSDAQYVSAIESVSLHGGNSGDIARAQHGRLRKEFARPSTKIKNSMRVAAWALRVEADLMGTSPDESTHLDEWVMSYAGFGKTGFGAEALEDATYRNGLKYYRDLKLGLNALFSNVTFDMVDANGARSVSDITIAKGHCISKVGRFPIEHWEEGMLVAETPAGLPASLWTAASLLAGHGIGKYTDRAYTFMPTSPVLMHLDGDKPELIQPNTSVTIQPSSATYNMLVTRAAYGPPLDKTYPDTPIHPHWMHY